MLLQQSAEPTESVVPKQADATVSATRVTGDVDPERSASVDEGVAIPWALPASANTEAEQIAAAMAQISLLEGVIV
eukprot:SAG31_NODE_5464_length_2523_cov_1.643152_1_plen_75_part_10